VEQPQVRFFTADDVWFGGFYELALEFDQEASAPLTQALDALWSLDSIEGCYLDRTVEPNAQPRLSFEPSLLDHGHLQGLLTLAEAKQVACGTCRVQETEGPDWLVFYVPMGALAQAYPVGGFPFDGASHETWRRPVDDVLARIGESIFDHARFRLGLVGFEVSGLKYAAELASSGVPEQRHLGYLVPHGARVTYHPRNAIDE